MYVQLVPVSIRGRVSYSAPFLVGMRIWVWLITENLGLKQLISNQSGFNTSQCCVDALTKKVIEESLKAIDSARQAGRKTVMGRDLDNRN